MHFRSGDIVLYSEEKLNLDGDFSSFLKDAPFYQAFPPARRITRNRRMGAAFWDIERLNENPLAPERAKAN